MRCFTTFICFGYAYVSVLTTLLLVLFFKLLESSKNSGHLPGVNPKFTAVIEAMDPFKWAPTWMSNTYNLFRNLHIHIMWKCICICPYHVTAALVGQDFGIFPRILITPQGQTTVHCGDWGYRIPFKWAPTWLSNTYNLFHNLHMMWMFTSTRLYHVTATLIGQAFECYLEFWWPPQGQTAV